MLTNLKELNKRMKTNWIMTLVLTAAVLSVVTSSYASASTQYWTNVDWSKLNSNGNAPWYSYVTNEISCSSGDTLKWQNTCENRWSGKSVYPTVSGGSYYEADPNYINFGYAWCPDGSITASSGWHAISVGHWYGNSYQGQNYASSGPQLISQPYQA